MTGTVSTPVPDTVALDPDRHVPGVRDPGFAQTLRAEWIKFWSVRSTPWSIGALVTLGAGLTVLVCAVSAAELADGTAGEAAGSFITWGMTVAQITAIVLGALVVTSEYGTGMIRATLTATPHRGRVLAAKALVLTGTLFVAGTVTAVLGYLGGNWFLEREGIGLALGDDGVLRSLLGSGLYLAGIGLFAAAVGLLVRHTAAALSIVLALLLVASHALCAGAGSSTACARHFFSRSHTNKQGLPPAVITYRASGVMAMDWQSAGACSGERAPSGGAA